MHAVFWLNTPIHPNEMDGVIRAELPHTHEDPVLHDSIKWHVLHGPCCDLNPNPPCMKDGAQNSTQETFTTRYKQTGLECNRMECNGMSV